MSRDDFYCVNCEAVRELDIHARCSCCGSDSVTPATIGRRFMRLPTDAEISKLFDKSKQEINQ